MIHFPSDKELLFMVVVVAVIGWVTIESALFILDWLFSHIEWK
ncbi:hypothetical protein Sam46_gp70 [Bacillus phage vB_BcM_Sam46]|uniref:Uncharacterized protein n=2 Tax=Caudoviricetes TaxID=2731619 RepID=A0A6G9L8A2_9CAUD|nr:hypothetical protein Sam112_gp68 [Bacillus phage vB_BcM_Sam112]QIQ61271.1 hypothetical protein Sam46_gp70 [Bacillus phage vB_BcM_Sam46]